MKYLSNSFIEVEARENQVSFGEDASTNVINGRKISQEATQAVKRLEIIGLYYISRLFVRWGYN